MNAVEGITDHCIGFLEGEEFEVGLWEEESGVCVFWTVDCTSLVVWGMTLGSTLKRGGDGKEEAK